MLAKAKANVMEQEARMFWRLVQDIKTACGAGTSICDFLDELDVLRGMTDSPALKARCTDAIATYGIRQNARRVQS